MSKASALTELLNDASAPYRDPLARLDWSSVDTECWWLPPDALSLSGVGAFEALPLDARRRLSHFEFAHFLEAGLWLEGLFIERLGASVAASGDPALRARHLHEIREEAGHSLMFLELMDRSGVVIPGAARHQPRFAATAVRLLPRDSTLFWGLVVIGEELPDKLARSVRRAVDNVTVSALVYHLCKLHSMDEARHIAHARQRFADGSARLGPVRSRLLAPLLGRAFDTFADYLFHPPATVYRHAGLPAGSDWARLARGNVARRDRIAQFVRPTLEFFAAHGWRFSSRHG